MKWQQSENGTRTLEGPMGEGTLYRNADGVWVATVRQFTASRWYDFNAARKWIRAAVAGEWFKDSSGPMTRLLHGGYAQITRDGLQFRYTIVWGNSGYGTMDEAMAAAGDKIARSAMQ